MKTIKYILIVCLAFLAIGCTTETGGQASKSSEFADYVHGWQETRGRVVNLTIDPDGRISSVEIENHATTQPSHTTIRRESAATTQPSITTTDGVKGNLQGSDAGEIGDFKFEGIQKSAGNLALAGLALLIAVGCYFLLPPPKSYFAIAFCVGIAVLALLMPWVLGAIALGVVILIILVWAIAHKQDLQRINQQLVGSVKNIIDDHPAQADSIKDSAARAQVDPKIKAIVKGA